MKHIPQLNPKLKFTYRTFSYGFNLVELMVIICIIGILAGVASVVYPAYVARSQVLAAISLLQPYVKNAQKLYSEFPGKASFQDITNSNIASLGGYSPLPNSIVGSITIAAQTNITPGSTEVLSLRANFSSNASQLLQNSSIILELSVDSSGTFSIACTSSVGGASSTINAELLPSSCR